MQSKRGNEEDESQVTAETELAGPLGVRFSVIVRKSQKRIRRSVMAGRS